MYRTDIRKTEGLNPALEPALLSLFQVFLSPLKEINGLFLKIFFFLVSPTLGSLLPLLEHRAEFP
jgi:hypothetical protein